MIAAFVVDASMAIAWIHPAQSTSETERWATLVADGATLHVPSLWPMEVANALLHLRRRKKLTEAEVDAALGLLRMLPIEIEHLDSASIFSSALETAKSEGLTLYDAAYLELAARRDVPLACKDAALRAAAMRRGIVVAPG